MDKDEWKARITASCKQARTYQPFFDTIIEQLAELMEIQDTAKQQYEASGGNPVIAHTNKGGHTNLVKNPALAVINECNQQALAYWRDLGLTPSGYKKLTGEAIDERKGGTLEAMLQKLEI